MCRGFTNIGNVIGAEPSKPFEALIFALSVGHGATGFHVCSAGFWFYCGSILFYTLFPSFRIGMCHCMLHVCSFVFYFIGLIAKSLPGISEENLELAFSR